METGIVEKCFNKGSLTVGSSTKDAHIVGGVVGLCPETYNTAVVKCFNLGNITSFMTRTTEDEVGGICGISFSLVSSCYNMGKITLHDDSSQYPNCGGIVGRAGSNQGSHCTIENCYNAGNVDLVKGDSVTKIRRGSITGITFNYDKLKNNFCYIYGDLKGIGEMVGGNDGGIEEVHEYTDKVELKKIADELGADYKEDTKNINEGFPILAWQDK